MFLVNVLAAASVIGIVHSAPTSTYRRRDLQLANGPEVLFFNQVHGLEDADVFESDPGRSVGGSRMKRLGSLSIVNPMDVLRERVLLELARRKMRQNQRQVDANRRLLQTIGKRAIPNTAQLSMQDANGDPDAKGFAPSKANEYLYAYRRGVSEINDLDSERHRVDQQSQLNSDRGTNDQEVWENHGEDPVVQEVEDDQTRRLANELNLL
ncbi:diuretic hormone 44 [Athalia rosae]|uniref:diuretic hormone 44 n=1 Tax=Athalia rosae TaxID=37344 RepID=UPI00062604DF|nr:diuretic hormone 44 [Athalia rosae]XP_048515997.1 diuretic hormone 44 [Athalia rosae]XP_048515998.1 diuretic hormone 44 [Athalia rosae]